MMNVAEGIMGVSEIDLAVPIKAHGEELVALKLRRPTTAEVRKIGRMPYVVVDESGKIAPDMGVVPDYVSICAGIPPSSVEQIDLSDLNQLAWAVVGFFLMPAQAASGS